MNDKFKGIEYCPEIMEYFEYEHLPERLANISKPFFDHAMWLVKVLPYCAERTVALRKLLESKDCAVRAALEKRDPA